MDTEAIREALFQLRDEEYRAFQSKLIPTVDLAAFIGVRTPELRKLARDLLAREGDADAFLSALPHRYFDENQLHAFILSGMRDFGRCVEALGRFLPYIDNWATCDQLSPKAFRKHRPELVGLIEEWLTSGQTYVVRFGVKALMDHFLDGDFHPAYLERVARIRSDEYYVNMMIAWYFATALAKQYEAALPFIEGRALAPWTHNRAIQKALESLRVPPEHKAELRRMKV